MQIGLQTSARVDAGRFQFVLSVVLPSFLNFDTLLSASLACRAWYNGCLIEICRRVRTARQSLLALPLKSNSSRFQYTWGALEPPVISLTTLLYAAISDDVESDGTRSTQVDWDPEVRKFWVKEFALSGNVTVWLGVGFMQSGMVAQTSPSDRLDSGAKVELQGANTSSPRQLMLQELQQQQQNSSNADAVVDYVATTAVKTSEYQDCRCWFHIQVVLPRKAASASTSCEFGRPLVRWKVTLNETFFSTSFKSVSLGGPLTSLATHFAKTGEGQYHPLRVEVSPQDVMLHVAKSATIITPPKPRDGATPPSSAPSSRRPSLSSGAHPHPPPPPAGLVLLRQLFASEAQFEALGTQMLQRVCAATLERLGTVTEVYREEKKAIKVANARCGGYTTVPTEAVEYVAANRDWLASNTSARCEAQVSTLRSHRAPLYATLKSLIPWGSMEHIFY